MRCIYALLIGLLTLVLILPPLSCEAKDLSILAGAIRTTNQSIAQDCLLCHKSQSFRDRSSGDFANVLISMRDSDPARLTMMSKVLYQLTDFDINEITKLLSTKQDTPS